MSETLPDELVDELIVNLLRATRKTKHHDLELTKKLHSLQRELEERRGVFGADLDGLGSECVDCGSEEFKFRWIDYGETAEHPPLCDDCMIERVDEVLEER